MLPRKTGRRGESKPITYDARSTVRHMNSQTVESLSDEIGRIVSERQRLRAAGAAADELEENRRHLAEAQSRLSQLLIERYLPDAKSA
jgi:hypothetical protein